MLVIELPRVSPDHFCLEREQLGVAFSYPSHLQETGSAPRPVLLLQPLFLGGAESLLLIPKILERVEKAVLSC